MARTILVVDDLASQRTTARLTLAGAGYHVEQACNGREALERLGAAADVEAVVSDLSMPEMDGLALVEALKGDAALRRIPVLVMLMESQMGRREELRKAGAAGWILKPYQPEQLRAVVAKLVPADPRV